MKAVRGTRTKDGKKNGNKTNLDAEKETEDAVEGKREKDRMKE